MLAVAFSGFAPELISFFDQLRLNNNRDWFQAHRDVYERCYVDAARDFVVAMGPRLAELGEGIHAEPKVRGSILAINRDIRFSPDKTPYKTYLDLWFWQGDGPSRERPGYFLRLDAEHLTLGAGMHLFNDTALGAYRQALQDPAQAQSLHNAVSTLEHGGYILGGQTLKRVPQGFPNADESLLRHTGLVASTTLDASAALQPTLVDTALGHFRQLQPLQQWLVTILPP